MSPGEMTNLEEPDLRLRECKRLFDSFDINKKALGNMLRTIGIEVDIECIESSCGANQKVDFPTVLDIIKSIDSMESPEKDAMKCIFREFDNDADGYISASDLERLLLKIGEHTSEHDLQAMINEADTDGDGKVSFNEFIQIISCPNVPSKVIGAEEKSDSIKDEGTSNNIFLAPPSRTSPDASPRICKRSNSARRSRKYPSPSRRSSYVSKMQDRASEIKSSIVAKRIIKRNSWK